MPTSPIATYNSPATTRLDPVYNAEDAEEMNVKLADGTYAAGTVLGELIGANATFTLTQTGSPTGGTFTLTYGGQTTTAIAYNASAATIQAALEALSSIGSGNVAATGGPVNSGAVTLAFQNKLGYQAVSAPTHTDSLTGGSTPAMAVAAGTTGSAGTLGTFKAYAYNATDGSQFPRVILRYACVVASGVVTLINEWGQQQVDAVSAFMRGYFNLADLVGLDANAIALLGGRIHEGTIAAGGVFRF